MRIPLLTSAFIGVVLSSGPALAQNPRDEKIQPAIGKDDKIASTVSKHPWKMDWKSVQSPDDFKPGKLLQLTWEGKETRQVRGILVSVFKKDTRTYLLVREGLSSTPTLIPRDEVKEVSMAVLHKASRDGIREVATADITTFPDIQQLVIQNGNKRTVSYFAATLSPGEKDQLTMLENAENELVRLEHLAGLENRLQEGEIAVQARQQQAQILLNDLIAKQAADRYVRRRMMPDYGPNYSPYGIPQFPLVQAASVAPASRIPPDALIRAQTNFLAARNQAISEEGRLVVLLLK